MHVKILYLHHIFLNSQKAHFDWPKVKWNDEVAQWESKDHIQYPNIEIFKV